MRPLAFITLALAYAQAVLGGIVRVTGSGMGCGDHWPKCNGEWLPPLARTDLVIEVLHRYTALALTLSIVALLVLAWRSREQPRVGRALTPIILAATLVVAAALLGALTVKLGLEPVAVLIHLVLAMALIAALVTAALRLSTLDEPVAPASAKTARAATAAASLAAVTVLMGGATANMAGAAASCVGFPHCRSIEVGGTPLMIQSVHRVLAFLLLFHLVGLVISMRKRDEAPRIRNAAGFTLGIVLVQILVAAAMVETGLPLVPRALHQALGTLVWLTTFAFAAMAREKPGTA